MTFRNCFLLSLGMMAQIIISSDETKKIQIKVRHATPEIVTYKIPAEAAFHFVNGNTKIKGPYSFVVQQTISTYGRSLNSLSVVWNADKMTILLNGQITSSYHIDKTNSQSSDNLATDGIEFLLDSQDALKAYQETAKHKPTFFTPGGKRYNDASGQLVPNADDTAKVSFDAKDIDRTKPEMKLLEIVMHHYAQSKMLTLKCNDEVLYKPSLLACVPSWFQTHQKAVGIVTLGCLGFALYCMLSKNTNNRLITTPHK